MKREVPSLPAGLTERHVRAFGAVQLSIAAHLAYYFGYLPLEATRHHPPELYAYIKLLLCCTIAPSLLSQGVMRLLFGRAFLRVVFRRVGRWNQLTLAGWMFAAILFLTALSLYVYLCLRIETA